jgi:hypothetical protein
MTEEIKSNKLDAAAPKPSIFVCKTCKSNTVEVTQRKPKEPKEPKSAIWAIKLEPSKQKDTKYTVKVDGKSISFGQKGASDFTITKDKDRKALYIARHDKLESQFWGAEQENMKTASFWARYLLWENEDIFTAIKEIETRMGCEIKYTQKTIEKH